MDIAEEGIYSLLKFTSLKVERISEDTQEQRADFRAFDNEGNEYIIEVKSSSKDEEFTSQLLKYGEAFKEENAGRTNPMSKKIREAEQQIATTSASQGVFRLIALVTSEEDPRIDATQFVSTIYGIVKLFQQVPNGTALLTPCFYFTFNEFYNLRDIDGVIILDQNKSQLCINSFSHKKGPFKSSILYKQYESNDAIIDPEMLEIGGEVFIVDCDIDRRDEDALLCYIQEKYNLENKPVSFTPKQIQGSFLFPREEFE